MKNLYDSLLLKGYSKEAAKFLAEKFPESTAEAIYEVATEGSKEEIMNLCENDSALFDREKDEFMPVTWGYIVKKYEGFDLPNGKFIIISSHQQ
jgi:hypothetical protein